MLPSTTLHGLWQPKNLQHQYVSTLVLVHVTKALTTSCQVEQWEQLTLLLSFCVVSGLGNLRLCFQLTWKPLRISLTSDAGMQISCKCFQLFKTFFQQPWEHAHKTHYQFSKRYWNFYLKETVSVFKTISGKIS